MIQIVSFVFSPFAENTYVLYDNTQEAVIIDPGCYNNAERKALQDFIAEKNLKIVKLLNTHCHLDHVFGNEFVKQTYNVKAYAHENEDFNLGILEASARMFGIARIESTRTDVYLKENDVVEFGNSALQVLFTPGHSPGHVVFYNAEQGFCINGDVLFRNSIGRTDLPGGNHQTLINAIRKVMFALPDDTTIFTGHGEPTTIGFEKKHNPFL
ncbi:MBL fold metallo-hydrolase [Raineya sp.]|jgi:glyoxylase-like metal-dependent hydrolase (beta-lactamase superfamily II)